MPATLEVGQQGQFIIQIQGDLSRLESVPQTIEVDGLTLEFAGADQRPSIINGARVDSMEVRFQVSADEPGSYTIPAQTIPIAGQKLTSEPVVLNVAAGQPVDEANKPQVQLTAGKTEMWQGESVPVRVSVIVPPTIRPMGPMMPTVTSDGMAIARFDRQMNEGFQAGGTYVNSYRMDSEMTAIKSGDLVLGPAEVKLDAQVSRGGAPDQFGGYPNYPRKLKATSGTVKLKVKPLPEAGKPEGFNGAVGRFTVSAVSENHKTGQAVVTVPLGDPVMFDLAVSGVGNFDAVSAPELSSTDGLRVYPSRVSQENRGWGTEPGVKVFSQIIFPLKPGDLKTSFNLTFFNPDTAKYETVSSQVMTFLVQGDEKAIQEESKVNGAQTTDFGGNGLADKPTEDLQDILPQTLKGGRGLPLTGMAPAVHPLLLHGVPAALLALLAGNGWLRKIRAAREANRPPPDAPRPPEEVMAALRREGHSRTGFYALVSEYIRSHAWHRKSTPAGNEFTALLAARDRWLYATDAAAASQPVTAEEQAAALATLSRFN